MEYNITYRKKNNGLQVIISYKDQLGKWKQKSKQGFQDTRYGKKQAKQAADEMLQELKKNYNLNIDDDFKNITFKEFYNLYLDHIQLHLEFRTIESYKNALNKFLVLDDILLSKLTKLHFQKCVDEMLKSDLKKNTIQLYVRRMKTILNSAIKDYNLINTNPANNLKLENDKFIKEKQALTSIELNDLLRKLSCLKPTMQKYYIASLIAGKCGLRVGEICGLQWNDIDFKNNILNVKRQLKQDDNKKWILGTLKSKNSYRIVPLSENIKKELLKYKNNNPVRIDNLIFKTTVDSLANNISKIYKKNGYNISIHELRHTYATLLIANNIDFKTTAKLLGHDVKETIKTYSHVTDEMMKKATELIKNIF